MSDIIYAPASHLRDSSEEFALRYPHHHRLFFNRADFARRGFFRVVGAGLLGSYLAEQAPGAKVVRSSGRTTRGTAKNCILVLLSGAISQMDSFDLKVTNGVTPVELSPTLINGVNWPVGLFPRLAHHLGDITIIRSMRAWALEHILARTWTQIGRNPGGALGDI